MMHNMGLTKLMEECGEVVQIAAKKAAYMDADFHPDGSYMETRMEEELGDLTAAIRFVIDKFNLDLNRVGNRAASKLALFERWDHE